VYIHFSKVIHHGTSRMNILYSNLYNTPSPILYYSTKFSVYLYPSSYTDAMYFDIIYFLSFSFLSLLPLVSSNYCYYNSIYIYTHIYIWHVCNCVYAYLLNLSSICERKHANIDFLNLAYFAWHDDLQFHPFTYKRHNFIDLYAGIKLPLCIYHIFLSHSSIVGYLGCFP
jgi:hypothetical protein